MENREELLKYLKSNFSDIEIKEDRQYPELYIPRERWHTECEKLKNGEIRFDFLVSITAVDYKEKFTLVGHLENTEMHQMIVIKSDIADRENPEIETISDLWPTSEFHEREIYDLFGIKFTNHPDLRRLFLPDDYGYPLRKDFKDDINIIELQN